MAWLSRLGLLAPLLLAAGQAVQPDSPESLACRLWDKLTEPAKDWPGLGFAIKQLRRSITWSRLNVTPQSKLGHHQRIIFDNPG